MGRALVAGVTLACCIALNVVSSSFSRAADQRSRQQAAKQHRADPPSQRRLRLANLSPDWRFGDSAASIGQARRAITLDGEIAPSPAMKSGAHGFPVVDRRLKGDPLAPLRPGLSDLRLPDQPIPLRTIARIREW